MERKHRKQFTAEEITYSEALIHGITEWNFAVDHVLERMEQKHISKQDLLNTLKYGEVIELNDRGRIVLRLMKGKRKGTCVVVSVRDRVLVTAWYNAGSDQHKTLNLGEYVWKVNVIEYLRSL